MSMYVVKRDDGEWLSFDDSREGVWYTNNPTIFNDKRYAEAQNTHLDGSHVVELVEAPAKIVVSKEEAEMLGRAKANRYPVSLIYGWCYECEEELTDVEDRLIRAYVNGYTVETEKKYSVKVPHTKDVWYYKADKVYLQTICPAGDKKLRGKFTESDIEHYGLQDCEKEEVKR